MKQYQKKLDQLYTEFSSGENGLSTEQAVKNCEKFGRNVITEGKKKSIPVIFLEQYKDFLVLILIIAAIVSAFMKDVESCAVILVVITMNAILGTVQTVKAEKSLTNLKKLSAPTAKALRNGEKVIIPSEEIAVGDGEFYISDAETGKRRIRSAETNLGDFVADGIYTYFNEVEQLHCDIAIMNGGGIRSDEDAGYWTFKTCKQVSPFGNVACLMSVTGKQIQDALEFAARFAGEDGKENGGFLQVAGATYEIHTDIPNTVQTDEKNVWIGSATGTPRVQNVKIYDKASGSYLPLDPGATYALAGMNYTLRNLGDGFAMFDGAELIKDYVSEDYLVMSTYAMIFDGADAAGLPHLSSANSPLAAYPGYLLNYEQPYGAGRITIL